MGARQSRRSVDITTTPKKDSVPKEGEAASSDPTAAEKIEKLGAIEEAEAAKPTSNGTAPHTESSTEDKDKDKDEASEKDKAKEKSEESKEEEAKPAEEAASAAAAGEEAKPAESSEVTTPTEAPATPSTPADTPNTKEAKKKDKKKKWSFRSISFSRKDKSKPVRDAAKNGDVAKEEPLAEGGEEAEAAAASAEKSAVSSPTSEESKEAPAVSSPAKEEKKPEEESKPEEAAVATPVAAPVAAAAPAKAVEEPAVAAAPAEKKVEVSPGAAVTTSPESSSSSTTITERKTTEDIELLPSSRPSSETITTAPISATSASVPPPLPLSPPPTPIDPSPLQQAMTQKQTPSATALAEALHESQNYHQLPNDLKPDNDDQQLQHLVLETEEGPIPVYVHEEEPKPEQQHQPKLESPPQESEKPAPPPGFEQLVKNVEVPAPAQDEEEVPPPLPECPAPVLEATSKIASFAETTMLHQVVDDAPLPEEKALDSLEMLPPPSPQQLEEAANDDVSEDISEDLPLPPPVHSEDVSVAASETNSDSEQLATATVPTPLQNGFHKEDHEPTQNDSVEAEKKTTEKVEIVATENGISDEVAKIAPPAVPQEAVQTAPAITEDVASVTKAIEEIDISDKAVAAVMNIENVGNEIVADSVHQNNLIE